MSLTGRDIVCVGFSDWDATVRTTQHHLMTRVARENRVLFVESLGLRQPQLAGSDLSRMARRLRRGLSPPRPVDGLHVLSPLVLPLHASPAARAINAQVLPRSVARATRRLGMREPLLWSFVPQAEVLLDTLRPSQVLYYVTDDHAAKPGIDADSFAGAESRFAKRADVIFATAPELVKRMQGMHGNVHYAPAVTDTRLFASALAAGPLDDALAALPEPRIVFTGAILAATVDIELVVELAGLRPSWSFAFVGPIGQGDPHTNVEGLRGASNVHLLGPRAQGELPAVLRGAAAAIIPYRTGEQMRSVFPMKTYEYLAAGRPVVSTPLEALRDVAGIRIASSAEEFARMLESEMRDDDEDARRARSLLAEPHSWESRLGEIAEALEHA